MNDYFIINLNKIKVLCIQRYFIVDTLLLINIQQDSQNKIVCLIYSNTGHSVGRIQQGTSLDYVLFPTKLIYQTLIVLNIRFHTAFAIRQNINTRDKNVI